MSHHKITEDEEIDQYSSVQTELWKRVFKIIDDLEIRLEKIENK